MSPADISLFIGQGVTVIGLVFALVGKRIRTPTDDDNAMKLGNEFLRGLLADAKSEREELRTTIEELRDDRKSHEDSLKRLTQLLKQKDDRIHELESTLDRIADKLGRGEPVTLADLVGRQAVPTS